MSYRGLCAHRLGLRCSGIRSGLAGVTTRTLEDSAHHQECEEATDYFRKQRGSLWGLGAALWTGRRVTAYGA